MGRPPVFAAEVKTRIVLSILTGELTVAQAARQEKDVYMRVNRVGDQAFFGMVGG